MHTTVLLRKAGHTEPSTKRVQTPTGWLEPKQVCCVEPENPMMQLAVARSVLPSVR